MTEITITSKETIDARGLCCPMPSVKTALALEKLSIGDILEVLTDDPVSKKDLPRWAESTGNIIVDLIEEDKIIKIYIKKHA